MLHGFISFHTFILYFHFHFFEQRHIFISDIWERAERESLRKMLFTGCITELEQLRRQASFQEIFFWGRLFSHIERAYFRVRAFIAESLCCCHWCRWVAIREGFIAWSTSLSHEYFSFSCWFSSFHIISHFMLTHFPFSSSLPRLFIVTYTFL